MRWERCSRGREVGEVFEGGRGVQGGSGSWTRGEVGEVSERSHVVTMAGGGGTIVASKFNTPS